MNMKTFFKTLCLSILLVCGVSAGAQKAAPSAQKPIEVGAGQSSLYLKALKGKRVAFIGNHTSVLDDGTHVVDYLLSKGVNVVKIFAPEHGFRGVAAAGAKISDEVDEKTGIPVVSLYGSGKFKPSAEALEDVDVMIYDIQDVGCRFYTYISTMTYVMEAGAENDKKVFVFDRPNPNGYYVDGNILDPAFKSFVGMHPVPIVYGMTAGEYAKMVNGEGWLKNGVKCDLTVIPCRNYTHAMRYDLPVAPSPNLATAHSIALYPSLCYFEGTPLSEGRGTPWPFEVFGSPLLPETGFTFTPESSKNKGVLCNGVDLRDAPDPGCIDLKYVIWAYRNYEKKDDFFRKFFDTLCGGETIRKQIEAGMSAEQIRESWKPGIEEFMKTRAKYLLYD